MDWRNALQADLAGMQRELESEAKQLQEDRGKQERLATTITNQMQADAQVIYDDYLLLFNGWKGAASLASSPTIWAPI